MQRVRFMNYEHLNKKKDTPKHEHPLQTLTQNNLDGTLFHYPLNFTPYKTERF